MAGGMKVVANEGDGPEPGYEWSILTLNVAHAEGEKMLTSDQYDHAADLVKQAARHLDPGHSHTLSVRAIEEFYEIRDKGGVLGNINLRVFFTLDRKARALIVLGVIKKQNDGPTPLGDKVRMRYRKRKYEEGVYGMATAMVKQKERE